MQLNAYKGDNIASINAGQDVHGLFLIGSASQMQAKNGPFWKLELRDATGSLEARIWSPLSQNYSTLNSGQIVEVEGKADTFREQLQLSIGNLRELDAKESEGLNLADFLLSAKRPPEEMLQEIETLCKKELRHKPWRKFMRLILGDKDIRERLLVAPAAKSVHHAWVGGLLEHMLGVAKNCLNLANSYPELDRQILLVGALTHDIGKLWELSGGLANDYTSEGRLIGHVSLGIIKLEPFLIRAGVEEGLALHLRHLILSHHGLPEYGAAREPQTAEAFALHHADNADAKIIQCRSIFVREKNMGGEKKSDEEGQEEIWSPWQNTLQRKLFLARHTPTEESRQSLYSDRHMQSEESNPLISPEENKKEVQCSLL